MPWDSDRLLQQIELGEDSRVEFKEVVFTGNRIHAPRRETVADELAAFGNTIGGTLIFSVSDAGEVRSMNRKQMDDLEAFVGEICSDSIRPPLAFVTQRLASAGRFVRVGRRSRTKCAGTQKLPEDIFPDRVVPGGSYRRKHCTACFNSGGVLAFLALTKRLSLGQGPIRSMRRLWTVS